MIHCRVRNRNRTRSRKIVRFRTLIHCVVSPHFVKPVSRLEHLDFEAFNTGNGEELVLVIDKFSSAMSVLSQRSFRESNKIWAKITDKLNSFRLSKQTKWTKNFVAICNWKISAEFSSESNLILHVLDSDKSCSIDACPSPFPVSSHPKHKLISLRWYIQLLFPLSSLRAQKQVTMICFTRETWFKMEEW